MDAKELQARVASGVLIGDGAMGTQIYDAGVAYEHCFDELCLSRPSLIHETHRRYLAAGAQVIQTNSFGANAIRLAEHELEGQLEDIARKSVVLARDVADSQPGTLVAGSVGPTGSIMAPIGKLKPQEAEDAFRPQVAALAAEGVDFLLLETFMDLREIEAALRACAAEAPGLAVAASMSFTDEGKTIYGYKPEGVARALSDQGAAIVGANCSVGPASLMDVLERMVKRVPGLTYMVQPNAGLPTYHGGRYIYVSSPEYMASYASDFVDLGVGFVGGCCGTGPEHVAEIAANITGRVPQPPAVGSLDIEVYEADEIAQTTSLVASGVQEKLDAGEFVVSVEIDPPKGIDATKLIHGAAQCRLAGVDAINIADSPLARARMSALSLANLIRAQVDIEIILHMSCRDRNLLGLQSEMMGAYAMGIRNILGVTGDPPSIGDYPHATGVFDVDAIGLTSLLARLNEGVDLAGKKLKYRTNFHLGVAVNPTTPDLETEFRRFQQKVDAGAQFAMTQPLFELEPMERFLEKCKPTIPILAGILPLRNYKHARFMHNEVPDITIPESFRERMLEAGPDGPQEGVAIAREFFEQIRPMCQGIYLMPPFDRFEMAVDIVDGLIEPT
ncbi:MAG: bifunctional homocysteine S-methyltransferase/methylenetetrahydrofolate reductase [Deltaproteobacteria bacterium]|nr:bifunctional homocysteine S-methyltransferase/methylenetetrahydrofolate reductase [Deltaproteobacteria bacterium]